MSGIGRHKVRIVGYEFDGSGSCQETFRDGH
jgi:hypothetical protein